MDTPQQGHVQKHCTWCNQQISDGRWPCSDTEGIGNLTVLRNLAATPVDCKIKIDEQLENRKCRWCDVTPYNGAAPCSHHGIDKASLRAAAATPRISKTCKDMIEKRLKETDGI